MLSIRGGKLTTRLLVEPRVRLDGDVPSVPRMTSRRERRQIYLCVHLSLEHCLHKDAEYKLTYICNCD
jgi:hypothetical protein